MLSVPAQVCTRTDMARCPAQVQQAGAHQKAKCALSGMHPGWVIIRVLDAPGKLLVH